MPVPQPLHVGFADHRVNIWWNGAEVGDQRHGERLTQPSRLSLGTPPRLSLGTPPRLHHLSHGQRHCHQLLSKLELRSPCPLVQQLFQLSILPCVPTVEDQQHQVPCCP